MKWRGRQLVGDLFHLLPATKGDIMLQNEFESVKRDRLRVQADDNRALCGARNGSLRSEPHRHESGELRSERGLKPLPGTGASEEGLLVNETRFSRTVRWPLEFSGQRRGSRSTIQTYVPVQQSCGESRQNRERSSLDS